MGEKKATGFRIIMVIGILLLFILLLGQTMSFINYDFTVSIGLQESENLIGQLGVAINKGFGVGDTIIYIPLLLIGLFGLWKRKTWGIFAMFGTLAITAYWPMISLFMLIYAKNTPDFHFNDLTSYAILLTLITIYGLWGMWYLYKNKNYLTEP